MALASTTAMSATVTAIAASESNPAYDTFFINIHEVRVTPRTAGQAADWNAGGYGGVTTWVPDVTLTFDGDNPGAWDQGIIWQSHVAVSVQREGDLLSVNERGGFDGLDPPEDVYFLDG
jgi:hypothetical protein